MSNPYYDNTGAAMQPEGEPQRVDVGAPVAETLPSLAEFASEPGGAWPKGWYGSEILEGYATPSGHTFMTGDNPSKAGDSRNFMICFRLDGGKLGTRNNFTQVNYRTSDFSAERLEAVKMAREQHKGTRGKWIGHEDLQRSSLALAQLGQLEAALGFRLPLHPSGHILAPKLVGQQMDVRLGMDENDQYNEINAFAKAGTRAKKK